MEEADAQVKAYEKNMEVYKLNQEFTRVVSPIDGMVSRYYLTVGNLVNQDQTLLTTVVSLDPMYAYFDVDEPTLLRIRKAINEGKIKPRESGTSSRSSWGCKARKASRTKGKSISSTTSSTPRPEASWCAGCFPIPSPREARGFCLPGMFVRIRLPIGQPHPAVLVIDRAVQSDQGMKYVYVVDKNTVQYRRVTTGSLQEDGLRVITEGLKPGRAGRGERIATGAAPDAGQGRTDGHAVARQRALRCCSTWCTGPANDSSGEGQGE